jgi:RNA polymerase sigma-70 factor (ECF subfamily)
VAEFLSTWRKVWTAEMDATLHEGWVAGILPALIADKINLTFSRSDITASKVQSRAAFLHLYRPSDFRGVLRRTGIAGRKRGTLNKATVARLALANPTKEIVIAPTVPAEFQNEMLSLMPRLRNFAMSLCRNSSRADDLVQDTIARAWANAESFQAGSNMIAWLMTILRNLYYGDFRKSGREVEDVDDVHAMAVKVAPAQESRMEFLDLKAAMAKLSPEHRQALLMIGVSSMSYEDMAEKVGVPVGTMKSRVSRARADLADILGYRP